MNTERNQIQPNEVTSEGISFESVNIQRGRGRWLLKNESLGNIVIDTYSIWDPQNWRTVAKRLAQGEICAMYVAGTYGVGQIAESPEWQNQPNKDPAQQNQHGSVILSEIKKRPAHLNLVSFMDPEDQINVIDVDRLPPDFKNHRWAQTRSNSYAWAEHHVYPLRQNNFTNPWLVRQDNASIACFWINGHFGYQGIVDKVRKLRKHGNFGGGSLNIHGMEPCYDTLQLKAALASIDDWLRRIKFILFDEFVEDAQIGRSQPIVSFAQYPPRLIREGSLSAQKIHELTGIDPQKDASTVQASSTTPYDDFHNTIVEGRVLSVKTQIRRYWYYLKENGLI